jgi:hypothetical protein
MTHSSLYDDVESIHMTCGSSMMTVQPDVSGSDMARANGEVTRGPMRRSHVAPSRRSTKSGGSTKYGGYHQI